MEPFAFCNRCRGMRVGWNRTYILHYMICKGAISRSVKLLMCTGMLSLIVFAFPVTAGFVFSDPAAMPLIALGAPAQAGLIPTVDPAIHSIDHLLSFYGIEPRLRVRISKAIVDSGKKYNVDPKLIAAIVIVESRANPFAISEADSVGVMQIHLPTWGETADRENINLFKVEDNVELGVRILSGYIAHYGLWEGVMRYQGMTDSPESQQKADDYAQKVRRIYQPQSVATAPIAQTDTQ
jgi:Transglycosylase SLT domain